MADKDVAIIKDGEVIKCQEKEEKREKLNKTTKIFLWDAPPDTWTDLTLVQKITNADTEVSSRGSSLAVGVTQSSMLMEDESMAECASGHMVCSQCGGVSFTERTEQIAHYKSDWHRNNLRRLLRCLPPYDAQQFEDIMGDVSSISGSDSESTDSSSDEDQTNLPNLTKAFAEMPSTTPSVENNDSTLHTATSRYPRVFLQNKFGKIFSVYRCLLFQKKNVPEFESDLLSLAETLPKHDTWTIIMLAAGHFAAAVFKGETILRHKTFHRYVVRAKRGTTQSTQDNKGQAAKSAGATLRRYNESALKQGIESLLEEWRQLISESSHVFLRMPKGNHTVFTAGGKQPVLSSKDARVRSIPFPTRRPTLREIKRVHSSLADLIFYDCNEDIPQHIFLTTESKQDQQLQHRFEKRDGNKLPKKKIQKAHQIDVEDISSSSDEDVGDVAVILHMCDQELDMSHLVEFDVDFGSSQEKMGNVESGNSQKISKKKKKKTVKQKTQEIEKAEILDEHSVKWRNRLFMACKTGDICTVNMLLETGLGPTSASDKPTQTNPDSLAEIINLGFGESGGTLLHVASRSSQPAVCLALLSAGADPASRDRCGHVPYGEAGDRPTKDEFRRFMADFPDKYDYTHAKIPGPLTKEMESERKSRESERRKAQRQIRKQKDQKKKAVQKERDLEKETERKEEEERQKYLNLSDREKRALAAERRLLAQMEVDNVDKPVLSRCYQCAEDLTGKTPFEYSDCRFCSTKCLQLHRKEKKKT